MVNISIPMMKISPLNDFRYVYTLAPNRML